MLCLYNLFACVYVCIYNPRKTSQHYAENPNSN